MIRSALVWVLAICLLAGGAHAEDGSAQTYAVMALIGDSITVSPFNGALPLGINHSARRLDQNMYIPLPVKFAGLDDIALGDIASAIRQRRPDLPLDILQTRNPGLYKAQDQLFDAAGQSVEIREALKSTLRERNVAYLILVTRHRTEKAEMLGDARMLREANLRLIRGSSGDVVKLEGLGFYVDDRVMVQNLKTLDFSHGVLVAYADLTVRLIEAKSLNVVREVTVTRSEVVSVSKPLEVGFNAWDEATMEQKIKVLQGLIGAAMVEAIPRLLPAQ